MKAPRQRQPKDTPAATPAAVPGPDRRRTGDEPPAGGGGLAGERVGGAEAVCRLGAGRASVDGLREFLDGELAAVVGLEPVKTMLRGVGRVAATGMKAAGSGT